MCMCKPETDYFAPPLDSPQAAMLAVTNLFSAPVSPGVKVVQVSGEERRGEGGACLDGNYVVAITAQLLIGLFIFIFPDVMVAHLSRALSEWPC